MAESINTEPGLDEPEVLSFEKLERKTKELETEINEIRSRYENKEDYLQYLEALYISSVLNWSAVLDEVVYLRMENARLKSG